MSEEVEVQGTDRIEGVDVQQFSPEDVEIHDELNVRPPIKGLTSKDENAAIAELADTLKQEGQLQPGKVLITGDGHVILLLGNRRLRAIKLVNENGGRDGETMLFNATVEYGELDDIKRFRRQALIENIHRRNFNPIEFAYLIQQMEKDYALATNKQVADYFGVSAATISSHRQLLELPPDLQKEIFAGKFSAQAAFDLHKTHPSKRAEVARKAEEYSAKDRRNKQKGKVPYVGDEVRETGRVQRQHVVKALRDTEGATERPITATRREILDWFQEQADAPANGWANGVPRDFCRYFVERWAAGVGSERTLQAKWDKVTAKADRGTETKLDKVDLDSDEDEGEEVVEVKPKRKAAKK